MPFTDLTSGPPLVRGMAEHNRAVRFVHVAREVSEPNVDWCAGLAAEDPVDPLYRDLGKRIAREHPQGVHEGIFVGFDATTTAVEKTEGAPRWLLTRWES